MRARRPVGKPVQGHNDFATYSYTEHKLLMSLPKPVATLYKEFRFHVSRRPTDPFVAVGFLVVHARHVPRTSNWTRDVRALMRHGLLISLNRRCDREQRFLIGCKIGVKECFIPWTHQMAIRRAIASGFNVPGSRPPEGVHLIQLLVSTEHLRPTKTETPQSLVLKGIEPFLTRDLTIRRDNIHRLPAVGPSPSHLRKHGRIIRPESEVEVVVNHFMRVTGKPVFPKDRRIFESILRAQSVEHTCYIIDQAWRLRDTYAKNGFAFGPSSLVYFIDHRFKEPREWEHERQKIEDLIDACWSDTTIGRSFDEERFLEQAAAMNVNAREIGEDDVPRGVLAQLTARRLSNPVSVDR